MTLHKDIALGQMHPPHNWEYADATARLAATGFTADDVGKQARQTDDNSIWILTDESPITWVQVGGAGSVPSASDTVAGKVELATIAETTTGTDATRAVTPDGLHDMTSLAGAAWFLDEDNMASDSATKTASQQSIKAYVDAAVAGGGVDEISELIDVDLTGLDDDYILVYDTGDSEWKVEPKPSGSGASPSSLDIQTMHRYPLWAHRGDIGSADSYPENTLEAVLQAALKGADGVEYDVWLSSDDVFHLMHDSTVSRTTTGSGNVNASNAATLAGFDIDAGFGYDNGRHGTSLIIPTLESVIEALQPYDIIHKVQLGDSADADATQLATDIKSFGGRPSQFILEFGSLTQAAAAKAVDPAFAVICNEDVSGADVDVNVDWLSVDVNDVTNLAYMTAFRPKRTGAYMPIADYGIDETTDFQNMWDRGATSFQTNNLDFALSLRKTLLYGAASPYYYIEFTIDGGVTEIADGPCFDFEIPYNGTPNVWTATGVPIVGETTGDIELDFWMESYASWPPTVADEITNTGYVIISGGVKGQDTSLSWDPFVANEWVRVNVNSCTDLARVTVSLKILRT